MIGNPVSRRANYRIHLIHNRPNLSVIDGKEVTPEERTKAEEFLQPEATTISYASPPPNKIALKLNYMSFDTMVRNGNNIQFDPFLNNSGNLDTHTHSLSSSTD
jgi:hypothetical protein